MGQIKNRAGQVFADFNEWKKWAEQPSEQHAGYNNVLPELVEFLGFYPHLLVEQDGSLYAEECTENAIAIFKEGVKGETLNDIRRHKRRSGEEFTYMDIYPCHGLDYAKYVMMSLVPKEDGTYILKSFENNHLFDGSKSINELRLLDGFKSLVIPNCVSEIASDALSNATLNSIEFPDTVATKEKIKVNLQRGWGPATIKTIYPLDIEPTNSGYNMVDDLVNERFGINYQTFKLLCELYPNAFKLQEDGKVIADQIESCTTADGRVTDGNMMMLSETEKFIQLAPKTNVTSKPYDMHSHMSNEDWIEIQGEEVVNARLARLKGLEEARVVAVELIEGFGEKKPVVIPATVETLFVNRGVDELIIEGNPKNIFFKNKLAENKVVVNAGIQEVSKALLEYYKSPRGRNPEQIIFNVPALCEEKSIIPGYIRATLAYRDGYEVYDVISEINTEYIVSMHPEEIKLRNQPVMGTRIHMASNGIERHQTLVVYEPMEMIAEKIKNA